MIVEINRTRRIIDLATQNSPNCKDAFQVADEYGYHHISVLDIENYNKIPWEGIEFNRLLSKNGILYRFNGWIGDYPFTGIRLEEIGKIL